MSETFNFREKFITRIEELKKAKEKEREEAIKKAREIMKSLNEAKEKEQ